MEKKSVLILLTTAQLNYKTQLLILTRLEDNGHSNTVENLVFIRL